MLQLNKKVLRECKRHTAHHVVSTPSVVLTGYPPGRVLPVLTWPGGYPSWVPPLAGYPPAGYSPWQGTPPVLTWPGGYPMWVPPWQGPPQTGYPLAGYPQQGTPQLDLAGYHPLGVCPMEFWVMLQSIMGYGYPPRCLPHGILGNVAKHYGIWVPPPLGVNRLKTLPSPSFGCGR